MPGPYNIYPAVDAGFNFPPEIRTAFIASSDVQAALDANRDQAVIQAGQSMTGLVNVYAGSVVPAGWLMCDGSAVDRGTYPNLYAAIGTTYGVGDNTSTFNLPNLKGRVVVGVDGTQGEFQSLGTASGEKYHQLNANELASHAHGINDPGHNHGQAPHGHNVYDGGHGHGLSDPGHAHNVYDPGHGHGVNVAGYQGFQLYQEGTAVRRSVALQGGSGYFAMTSSPDNSGIGFGGVSGSGTGVSIYGTTTGIAVQSSGANIGIYNTTAGNYASASGVSVQNNGGNQAHNNLQPYIALNYIIHI